ncbi:hypothetical protein R1sor_015289 [Riccia sorocarpa]|uniref:Uncharacterized protein n=1 Tax=Riccia sorocarpa TaxID=122646 RepID=A0ABD3HBU5_9MARC
MSDVRGESYSVPCKFSSPARDIVALPSVPCKFSSHARDIISEPDRPVSQATSSLAAGHDVPEKHISHGHGGEARYNSSPDTETGKKKLELDTETGKKKLEPDTETGKKKLEPDTETGKKKLEPDTETGKKDTNWTEERVHFVRGVLCKRMQAPERGNDAK